MELQHETVRLEVTIRRILKLVAAGVAFCGTWILLLALTARGLQQRDLAYTIAPALGLAAAIPFVALASVALTPWIFASLAALLTASFFLIFPFSVYTVLAAALSGYGLYRSFDRTQFEMGNNVKFSSYRILSRVSGAVIVTFVLAVSVISYSMVASSIRTNEAGFYDRVADSVTSGILPVIEQHLPGFSRGVSLDQYLLNSFQQKSGETANTAAVKESVTQSRIQILDQLGITATGQEPLSEIVRRALSARLRDVTHPYQNFAPLLYTLFIFLLLRSAATLIEYAAKIFGLFVFWFLRKLGYLKVTLTQITAEHVEV